jgi:hypothetical protein
MAERQAKAMKRVRERVSNLLGAPDANLVTRDAWQFFICKQQDTINMLMLEVYKHNPKNIMFKQLPQESIDKFKAIIKEQRKTIWQRLRLTK